MNSAFYKNVHSLPSELNISSEKQKQMKHLCVYKH